MYIHKKHSFANLCKKLLYGLSGQATRVIINLALLAIMSRLVSPEDLGIFALASIVVNFVAVLRDSGFAQPVIQKKEISESQLDSLFWINFAVAILLGVLTLTSGLIAAKFYSIPVIYDVNQFLAVAIFCQCVVTIHRSLLQRSISIVSIQIIETLSLVLGAIVAVALAYFNYGLWALVAQQIISSLTILLATPAAVSWHPKAHFRYDEVKELISSGLHVTQTNMCAFGKRYIDTIAMGKVAEQATIGAYARGQNLLIGPISQLLSVIRAIFTPELARRYHESHGVWEKAIASIFGLYARSAALYYCLLIILSEQLLVLFLGPNLKIVLDYKVALLMQSFAYLFNSPVNWMLYSAGKTREILRQQAIGLGLVVVVIIATMKLGAIYLAHGVSIANVIISLLNFKESTSLLKLDKKVIYKSMIPLIVYPVMTVILVTATSILSYTSITTHIVNDYSLAFLVILIFILSSKKFLNEQVSGLLAKIL